MRNRDDWEQEVEVFRAAALREHALMRTWMARALTAETRLKMYDAREASYMSTHNVNDLGEAFCQHYNAFQRLTFILERKGLITPRELAEVYDELECYDLEEQPRRDNR